MTAALEARSVGFAYEDRTVFESIDLKVDAAEMVAIIGPNGSGKTTLLKLLSGTIGATRGRILLSGGPLDGMPSRERARQVAVVPQESVLTFDFTVSETVLMGRIPHLGFLGVEGTEDLAAADEAMLRTGTRGFAGRSMARLSGGERQLVLIARALAQKPRVLLLDEPTAYLDIRHRLAIYRLLVRLNTEEGLTIITTSHDINMAARHCRRIILIKEGRIVADGPPLEVIRPDLLTEVYETPLDVSRDPAGGHPIATPASNGS